MSAKLKPCPFCGSKLIEWQRNSLSYACGDCCAEGPFGQLTKGNAKTRAKKYWNGRVTGGLLDRQFIELRAELAALQKRAEAAIAKVRAKQPRMWIPASEKPDPDTMVLISNPLWSDPVSDGFWDPLKLAWANQFGDYYDDGDAVCGGDDSLPPTHWMPLPEHPAPGKEAAK